MSEREKVLIWLEQERPYQESKYSNELRVHDDDEMRKGGIAFESFWYEEINRYFHRANLLGLQSEGGKRAAAKGVATAIGMLESVIRVYGELPPGGVPS